MPGSQPLLPRLAASGRTPVLQGGHSPVATALWLSGPRGRWMCGALGTETRPSSRGSCCQVRLEGEWGLNGGTLWGP